MNICQKIAGGARFSGETSCDEISLPVSATPATVVPCGATAIWENKYSFDIFACRTPLRERAF